MTDQRTDMVTSALLGFRREQLLRSARPLRSARRRRQDGVMPAAPTGRNLYLVL